MLTRFEIGQSMKKPRVVVFGVGMGIVSALMPHFKQEFDVVANIRPQMPRSKELLFLLLSARWPKSRWRRRWRYYVEKTPYAFKQTTLSAQRHLEELTGKYDFIITFGATHGLGRPNKPYIVFADFCRRLSSLNKHDEISHFRTAEEESTWLSLEGDVYRGAAHVFTGSSYVRNAMITHYKVEPERVTAIGFGAGLSFGERYEKHFDGRTILYVGKGDFEKKGGLILLEAFTLVRKTLPEARLHIVGQDRLPKIEGVVNEGILTNRQRLVDLMRSAHVLTLPSLTDRFGVVLIEAMAASTPCISSDYAAMPEVVGDAGLVVPCNDAPALATALATLLTNEDLSRRLGEIGRQRFETQYNWDVIWQTVSRIINRDVITSFDT